MFTIRWLVETLNAPILADFAVALHGVVTGISIDTRTIQPGDLFFALRGEHSDGHDYVKMAFEKGAIAAVVSHPIVDAGGRQIRVPDTLRAFGDLAGAYRRLFNISVVGVTGSVGKTSTKEMIAAVLRTRYETLANEKNFNNEIGVPLTLFQLEAKHEVAVIEMGMRGLGEIDRLAEIAAPTIGLITNIGYAHIERLGSRENILRAKTELYQRLPQDGIAIVPADSEFYEELLERVPAGVRKITFSVKNEIFSDVRLINGALIEFYIVAGGKDYKMTMQSVGSHVIANALAALAVGVALNVDIPDAILALEVWKGAAGRMEFRLGKKGVTVLDDCYNAGVESMEAALETLREFHDKRIAILGDMRELGDFTLEAHERIGRKAADVNLRMMITVGELAAKMADAAQEVSTVETHHFADSDEAAAQIWEWVQPGDTVLVKGSRAMQMEKIVAALTGEKDGGAHA